MPARYCTNRQPSRVELRRCFDGLRGAAVDASSIIYMVKAGFFGLLGHTIRLLTIEPILKETGWKGLDIEIIATTPSESDDERVDNDTRLFDFAGRQALPLISDDRELLERAAEAGMEHYNSLMMLLFLKYRGRIDDEWFHESLGHLLSLGRYGDDVLRRFETIMSDLTD